MISLLMLLLLCSLQGKSMNILIKFIFKAYKPENPYGIYNGLSLYNFNYSSYYEDNGKRR